MRLDTTPKSRSIGFRTDRERALFRDLLIGSGYARWADAATGGDHSSREQFQFRCLTGDPTLNVLIRLFRMGIPVQVEQVRTALSPLSPADLVDAGLLRREGGRVRATLRLQAYRGLVLACDPPESGVEADKVVGVGGATEALANATVRRLVRRTLDVGTGGGVQALLAARHSDHVVGVDCNERALSLARFNARLNGVSNVEFRSGSFFEPVAGERFDLIVANPPFVISPESRFVYRDNGFSGDSLCRWFVEQAPAHLEAGGVFQMLCNWARFAGEGPYERIERWLEASGCEAELFCLRTDDPAQYAGRWIRDSESGDAEAFAHRFDRWTEHFRELGVEAISLGLVTTRRRNGKRWVHCGQAPAPTDASYGEGVYRALEAGGFLRDANDEDLLDHRFRLSDHVQWTRRHALKPGGPELLESRLKLTEGMVFEGVADGVVVRLLTTLGEHRPLRNVVEELVSGGHLPDWPRIAPEFLAAVRQLVQGQFLLPVEPPSLGREDEARPAASVTAEPDAVPG